MMNIRKFELWWHIIMLVGLIIAISIACIYGWHEGSKTKEERLIRTTDCTGWACDCNETLPSYSAECKARCSRCWEVKDGVKTLISDEICYDGNCTDRLNAVWAIQGEPFAIRSTNKEIYFENTGNIRLHNLSDSGELNISWVMIPAPYFTIQSKKVRNDRVSRVYCSNLTYICFPEDEKKLWNMTEDYIFFDVRSDERCIYKVGDVVDAADNRFMSGVVVEVLNMPFTDDCSYFIHVSQEYWLQDDEMGTVWLSLDLDDEIEYRKGDYIISREKVTE